MHPQEDGPERAGGASLDDAGGLDRLRQLAGGLAHRFNNLLLIVLGNAELLRRELANASEAAELVNQIEEAGQRAADLTRQMRVFAGDAPLAARPVSLAGVVRALRERLEESVPGGIWLQLDLEADPLEVVADEAQLQQAVVNLVANAIGAIEETGTIVVRVGSLHAGRDYLRTLRSASELAEGEYAYVEVVDSGRGVAPRDVARLFDPFFTRDPGSAGLGLATVLGIVFAHGGGIEVETAPGSGTRVRVLLPPARRVPRRRHPGAGPARDLS